MSKINIPEEIGKNFNRFAGLESKGPMSDRRKGSATLAALTIGAAATMFGVHNYEPVRGDVEINPTEFYTDWDAGEYTAEELAKNGVHIDKRQIVHALNEYEEKNGNSSSVLIRAQDHILPFMDDVSIQPVEDIRLENS